MSATTSQSVRVTVSSRLRHQPKLQRHNNTNSKMGMHPQRQPMGTPAQGVHHTITIITTMQMAITSLSAMGTPTKTIQGWDTTTIISHSMQ